MTKEQYKKASDILNQIAELANENDDMNKTYAGIMDSLEDYVSVKVMPGGEYDSFLMIERKRFLYMIDAGMRSNLEKIKALNAEFDAI